jgi:hypothetical protein
VISRSRRNPIQKLQMILQMKTIEDVRKKLQEINEHIKKEHNSLKFQYRIGLA